MQKLKISVLAAGISLLSLAVATPAMAADGATIYKGKCFACHRFPRQDKTEHGCQTILLVGKTVTAMDYFFNLKNVFFHNGG